MHLVNNWCSVNGFPQSKRIICAQMEIGRKGRGRENGGRGATHYLASPHPISINSFSVCVCILLAESVKVNNASILLVVRVSYLFLNMWKVSIVTYKPRIVWLRKGRKERQREVDTEQYRQLCINFCKPFFNGCLNFEVHLWVYLFLYINILLEIHCWILPFCKYLLGCLKNDIITNEYHNIFLLLSDFLCAFDKWISICKLLYYSYQYRRFRRCVSIILIILVLCQPLSFSVFENFFF